MEQNRRPEISPHSYIHLIFDKGAKKHIGSSTNGTGKTGYLHIED
jgi:hypothetical protein